MTFTNYSSIIQAIFTALEIPLCVYLNLPLCLFLENMTFIIPIHICLLQDVIWLDHTTCRYFHISLFHSVIYEFPKCLLCLQVSLTFFWDFIFNVCYTYLYVHVSVIAWWRWKTLDPPGTGITILCETH